MIQQIIINLSTVIIIGCIIWLLVHIYLKKEKLDERKKEFFNIESNNSNKSLAELVDESNKKWAERNDIKS